jgi:hypothetical protein
MAPGIGEIIVGQREERLDVLDMRMAERGIDQEHCLVPRPAPLWHGAARGLRPQLRAHPRLCHRPRQGARRDPVPAHPGNARYQRNGPVVLIGRNALAVGRVRPPPRRPALSPIVWRRETESNFRFPYALEVGRDRALVGTAGGESSFVCAHPERVLVNEDIELGRPRRRCHF